MKDLQKQIDEDSKVALNVDPCTNRFNCFGCIGSACANIQLYCENVKVNVKNAESYDQEIKKLEEVDSIDQATQG